MGIYSYNSNHKIVTVVLIVSLIAFFHFKGKENRENERYFSNGQLKFTGSKEKDLNHGRWIWYYENGQKSIEGEFQNGNRQGIWKQYDSLGNLAMTSTYVNNKLNGVLIIYAMDGTIISQLEYREDTIYKRLIENP